MYPHSISRLDVTGFHVAGTGANPLRIRRHDAVGLEILRSRLGMRMGFGPVSGIAEECDCRVRAGRHLSEPANGVDGAGIASNVNTWLAAHLSCRDLALLQQCGFGRRVDTIFRRRRPHRRSLHRHRHLPQTGLAVRPRISIRRRRSEGKKNGDENDTVGHSQFPERNLLLSFPREAYFGTVH